MNSPATNEQLTEDGKRAKGSVETRCMELLSLVIDGQATPEELAYFHQHITQCIPLYQYFKLESAIKETLARKMEKKRVPPHLIASIKNKIGYTA